MTDTSITRATLEQYVAMDGEITPGYHPMVKNDSAYRLAAYALAQLTAREEAEAALEAERVEHHKQMLAIAHDMADMVRQRGWLAKSYAAFASRVAQDCNHFLAATGDATIAPETADGLLEAAARTVKGDAPDD